jgi:hypothetical protein
MNAGPLDSLPLWASCLATISVGFLSVEADTGLAYWSAAFGTGEGVIGWCSGSGDARAIGVHARITGSVRCPPAIHLDEANATRTAHLRSWRRTSRRIDLGHSWYGGRGEKALMRADGSWCPCRGLPMPGFTSAAIVGPTTTLSVKAGPSPSWVNKLPQSRVRFVSS